MVGLGNDLQNEFHWLAFLKDLVSKQQDVRVIL